MCSFNYDRFRDEVSEKAHDRGISMEALARHVANVSRGTLYRQLNGRTMKLDVNLVADLCSYLSLDPSHYFCMK